MSIKIKSVTDIINKYDHFIFDMDGVIWTGGQFIESGVKGVKSLIEKGKSVYFLTNNSTKSRQSYFEILSGIDIKTDLNHIYSSSYLTAVYLKMNNYKKAFNLGVIGITEELSAQGIKTKDSEEFKNNQYVTYDIFNSIKPDEDIDCVVSGHNPQFNYYMLCYASLCIQKGCKFVAANPDSYIKVQNRLMPAGGCIQAILERATGEKSLLIGKPSSTALEIIMKQNNIEDKSKIVMIGDNPETDIEFGWNCGIDTILVTTGVTSQEQAEHIKTTYVCDHLYI
ncbi:unnamed protein product [Paramecium sonneborni]|uniref:4-nitrophenylphosphatase n=1 Tax=Paramecium sonneborni TaxID=65129 RepID=A0A8S1MPV3_9CILI|nr:unnamed protein product [Paramecium sonneborni]